MVYSPFAPETALPMTVPFLSSTLTRSPWTGFRSLLRTVPATLAQYAVVAASARLKPISDAIILLTITNSSCEFLQQSDNSLISIQQTLILNRSLRSLCARRRLLSSAPLALRLVSAIAQ